MHLLPLISQTIQQHSTETDDERAARLNDLGDDLGINPEALYRSEEHISDLLDEEDEEAMNDALADLAEDLATVAGMDIDGQQVISMTGLNWAALRPLLVRAVTANAAAIAPAVKVFHDLYQSAGVYQELGAPDANLFDSEMHHPSVYLGAGTNTQTPAFAEEIVDDLEDQFDPTAESIDEE